MLYSNVPHPFFLCTAHPILTMGHEGTPQNFALNNIIIPSEYKRTEKQNK
jgi:hypothetical protein